MMNNEQHNQPLSAAHTAPFQSRVQPWMMACFGAEISADGAERNHRFLEESLELVQACGCTASEAHQLVEYVYGRPVGERAQEVGGVMVTLAALCLAQGLEMHAAGDIELARIWTKVEAIRAKQAAKPKHSPLPAAAPQVVADERQAFESWIGLNEELGPQADRYEDTYTDNYVGEMWESWQARAALQAAPVPAQEPVAEIERLKKCLENCNAEIAQLRGDSFSGRAPGRPVAVPVADPRPLFDRKLADLEKRGYSVIGRILHKDGQYALFDSSCRWLEKAQYQRLMHEQDGSLFAAQAAQPSPVAVPDGWTSSVRKLVEQLDQYHLCMSYNDSYFGEPAGLVKQTVRQLSKLMDAAPVGMPLPVAVPDGDPVAWIRKRDITELVCCEPEDYGWTPLFAAPAAQGDAKELTDDEITKIIAPFVGNSEAKTRRSIEAVRAAIAAKAAS